MKPKSLLSCALCVTLLAVLSTTAAAAGRKLNVLFLASDDMRPELGCYGNPIVQSPNIDKLAACSVRFDRAYVQFPLCTPSRTSLWTGRYPSTSGVMDNSKYFRDQHPDWVTIPQYFRNHGYVTARTGKQFHGGIDDLPAWVEGGEKGGTRPPRTAKQAQDQRTRSDRGEAVADETETLDYQSATTGIELLEKHHTQPFFIAIGFAKPHSPLVAPKKYFDLYDASKIPLPPDFQARPKALAGAPEIAIPERNGDLFIGRDATPEAAREMKKAYFACISFVDAQVGRVLAAVDRLQLWENTVIVFWGDHGYHLGEKGKWSKHNSLYEVGTRVPLIVYAPGMKGNGKPSARIVETLDLYPTLAELCGLPAPQGPQGNSLVPLLKNPDARWTHPAVTETPKGKTIRTERWRYTEWEGGTSGFELYDASSDPHELKNLAADPGHAKTVAAMKRLLHGDWQTVKAD
jgi:arylsulfatase A-like enzyme